MTKQERIEDWEKMYKSLTDKDEIQKNIREEKRKKIMEDKKKDTGIL